MSRLPSGSTARTWKTWTPPPSGPGIVCWRRCRAANSPCVERALELVDGRAVEQLEALERRRSALVSVVSSSGPVRTSVSGPDMSTTVQFRVAPTGSMLPAASIAWTTRVCAPGVVTSISSERLAAADGLAVERALEVELERRREVVGAGELEDADEVRGRRALGRSARDEGRRRRDVGPDDLPLVDRGRQVDPAELVDAPGRGTRGRPPRAGRP